MEAKAVAAKRRTTLKAMVEHALRREIGGGENGSALQGGIIEKNEFGFPVLKRSGEGFITSEQVYALLEDEDL